LTIGYANAVDMFLPTNNTKNTMDMFPLTNGSQGIHSVLSSHVECIILMTSSTSEAKK